MWEFNPFKLRLTDQATQSKMLSHLIKAIGNETSPQWIKPNIWIIRFTTRYNEFQLTQRIQNELREIEPDVNEGSCSGEILSLVQLKVIEEADHTRVTVFFCQDLEL
ncbi:hypothetical protein CEW46_21545 [Bacillus cereus]|nr:hypothetical protein CEW46_21545 [Bacillus cereus]